MDISTSEWSVRGSMELFRSVPSGLWNFHMEFFPWKFHKIPRGAKPYVNYKMLSCDLLYIEVNRLRKMPGAAIGSKYVQ